MCRQNNFVSIGGIFIGSAYILFAYLDLNWDDLAKKALRSG
jgi:hypothetical protein